MALPIMLAHLLLTPKGLLPAHAASYGVVPSPLTPRSRGRRIAPAMSPTAASTALACAL